MTFENEWSQLKSCGVYGSFVFKGSADSWRSTVLGHFRSAKIARPAYGVYVVRQKSSGVVIYIGKSGTLKQDGSFKDQDFQKRLVNREKGQPRKIIFGQRVAEYGELLIEYVVLDQHQLIPGYAEALLLQAYYKEHGQLPPDNSAL